MICAAFLRECRVIFPLKADTQPACHGSRAVGDAVLYVAAELGERPLITFRHEYGVVAEAGRAFPLVRYGAFYPALEGVLHGQSVLPLYQGYDGAEARAAVLHAFHLMEQLAHVGFRVVTLASSVSRAVHSGRSVKSVHLQTGVVSEARCAVSVVHVARLHHGVALKRGRRFGYVVVASYVGERQHFDACAENLPYLFELMTVVCREYYLHLSLLLLLSGRIPRRTLL